MNRKRKFEYNFMTTFFAISNYDRHMLQLVLVLQGNKMTKLCLTFLTCRDENETVNHETEKHYLIYDDIL